MSAICWRIGDAPTSWPVLRSCRLSFEIVAHAKTIDVTKSAKATSAGRCLRRRRHGHDEDRRAEHDRQDADARDRAVRRADESRHVAADAGDEEADEQHERHGDERQRRSRSARARVDRAKVNARHAGDGEADDREPDDPRRRHVAVACRRACDRAATRRASLMRPPTTGFASRGQRVDRGDADRARADEPHLRAPDRRACARRAPRPRRPAASTSGSARRSTHAITSPSSIAMPTDSPTRWPRRAARATRRCCSRSTPCRRAGRSRATSPAAIRVAVRMASPAEATEPRMTARQAFPRLAGVVLRLAARARADLQHLGRGDAFRIGQVGVGDERAAERDREQHAEDRRRSGRSGTTARRETRPPADDHQSRQHEDDRRERAGRRRDRLDDVVLEDRRVLERGSGSPSRSPRRGSTRRR